jgi:hypothetical protein
VKPRFIVLTLLILIIGASGFLYLESIREHDQDLADSPDEDDLGSQHGEIEKVETPEPQPGEEREAEEESGPHSGEDEEAEEAEPQPEEDDVTPEEPEAQTALYIDNFEFTQLPAPEEYIASITPLGWLGASMRTSPDVAHPLADERHHVFFHSNFTEGIPIFAPSSGFIEWASVSPSNEWGFTIIVNETLSYYLDHIGYLNSTLLDQLMQIDFYVPNQIYVNRGIRVEAGQVIGYTNTTQYFDWGIVDKSVVDGIANQSHYTWERYIHGVSAYEYASDELKILLKMYYGLWNEGQNRRYQQVGEPVGGRVRNDINGTLQGVWFFDHVHDGTWGKKVALFSPYSMNRSNYQMRLSIPELSVYGNWQNMILGSTGNLNLKPHLVNTETGIVGYTTDWNINTGEEGLLLVQLIDDFHIKLETFEGVRSMPETPEFTEKAVILYR